MWTEVYTKCDNCRSDNTEIIYSSTLKYGLEKSNFTVFGELGEYPQVVKCKNCSLVYANPRDKSSDLEKKYKNLTVEEYLEEADSRQKISKKDAELVATFCKGGRVLDVGCSAGIFLSQLNSSYIKFGVEPSQKAVHEAKKNVPEGNFFNCVLKDAPLKSASFDVITMWDVIEHLESPSRALLDLNSLLTEDGYLILVTPNISGIMSLLMKKKWPHLIRGHLYYYTPKTIRRALNLAGFDVLSIKGYTRYFKISYILKRVGLLKRNSSLPALLESFDITVPLNLGDAMCVVARKVSHL